MGIHYLLNNHVELLYYVDLQQLGFELHRSPYKQIFQLMCAIQFWLGIRLCEGLASYTWIFYFVEGWSS